MVVVGSCGGGHSYGSHRKQSGVCTSHRFDHFYYKADSRFVECTRTVAVGERAARFTQERRVGKFCAHFQYSVPNAPPLQIVAASNTVFMAPQMQIANTVHLQALAWRSAFFKSAGEKSVFFFSSCCIFFFSEACFLPHRRQPERRENARHVCFCAFLLQNNRTPPPSNLRPDNKIEDS